MAKRKTKTGAISKTKLEELKLIALMTRVWIINMTHKAGSGHPGGSLSATDILTALYFNVMDHDPKSLEWEDRDRFVLSKGHAAPALYACLAQAGYFDKNVLLDFLKNNYEKFHNEFINSKIFSDLENGKNFPLELLMTLRKLGSPLQGHPDMTKTPGVEASTGSEGQGLSIAIGMALAGKLNKKDYRVYVMLGDGEMDCGQIWEAAMAAAFFKVNNLTAIIDRNKLQLDGKTKDIMEIEPLKSKWLKFGWNVIEINGHSIKSILKAVKAAQKLKKRPTVIIANTTKGKGVKDMENNPLFHGKAPDSLEYLDAFDRFLKRIKNRKLALISKKNTEIMKKTLKITHEHMKNITDEEIIKDARRKQKNIDEYLERKKKLIKKIGNLRNKL